jgi:hypothetical protein
LLYLVSPLLVVVGILGLFSLSSAISKRQSWWRVRDELYGLFLFAGTVAVFIAFSFLALNYLPGPDWFWFLVGFVGLFLMCFLIHEKFGIDGADSPLNARGVRGFGGANARATL